ncbi:MAG: hypothetical protein KDA61_02170 [Planctomycetales bacterium]|nr:hypothetical protein [Planctomycetales bacterium]
MKLTKWGALALALSVLTTGAIGTAKAQNSDVRHAGGFQGDLQEAELAQYAVSGSGVGFGGGGFGGSGAAAFSGAMSRPIQLIAGAQYVYARANVSEGLAYVRQDLINGIDEFVQYDFNYKSSYGFYGGVYLCDCGGSVIFDYTRYQSDATFAETEVNGQTELWGPYEVDNILSGFADVDLSSYNLSFSKTIPLGCPLQGGGCSDSCCGDTCCGDDSCAGGCGDACGCCGCPAWDITWTAGVRWADADWTHSLQSQDVLNTTLLDRRATTRMDFSGFGGRVGIGGRRYLGAQGLASLYAKGDISVLMGDIEVVNTVFEQDTAATTIARTKCTHVVPVTEIELGGTLHLGCHANVSAGYFFAAWHDLGFRDEYDFTQFQTSHYDDANILGFDGFFARAELTF